VVGPLADGSYTFSVRAIDGADNVDATPATRAFAVETSAPDTVITSGPTGATGSASPFFGFDSTKPGSTFECKLDGPGSATGSYAACTSPRAYASLADGSYTFSVRATDGLGTPDASPATRSFTVDTTAPDTTITGGPSGTTTATNQSFTFTSEAETTFECKLDAPSGAGTYAACTSPQAYTTTSLCDYTFSVRAKDAVGNVDASPATRAFTVEAVATPTPTATPTVTPTATPTVTPTATPTATSVPGEVIGNVPATLALTIGGPATFGAFIPGVAAEYTASTTALVTSSAASAILSVADPSDVATGRMVNGADALTNRLQARATTAAQPASAFAPITGTADPLTLLTYPTVIAADPVTITVRQTIGATEPLRAGAYTKTLTFTLSATTP
jgi:hypothetical protein